MLFCVADTGEASRPYERYLGRRAEAVEGGYVLQTERGRLALLDVERVGAALPGDGIPCMPFMAAYALACENLASTRALLGANGIGYCDYDDQGLTVPASPELGGSIVFTGDGGLPPWLSP